MIKILIVDDHFLIREGLKKILKQEPGYIVVGELDKGNSVQSFLLKNECDLIILDLNLPDRNGLDVLKDIKSINSDIHVLILSISDEENFAIRALKSGASGYITKDKASDELIKAIKKVISGGKYISEQLAEKLANEVISDKNEIKHKNLSDREFQILLLLGAGKSVKEIAAKNSLSISTINTYKSRIFEKMSFNNTAQLILYVMNNNLL